MDDLRSQEELAAAFLDQTHELLLRCSQIESFIFQWLELLEEGFGFHPVTLFLPSFPQRKIFSSVSNFEELVKPYFGEEISQITKAREFSLFPLEKLPADHFVALPHELKRNPLHTHFLHNVSFFLRHIHKTDALTRKLKIARFGASIRKSCEEATEPVEILNAYLDHTQNEHAFFWQSGAQILCPSDTRRALEPALASVLTALNQTKERRDLFVHEEFHEDVKSLILYPVFDEEDLLVILGSFSSTNPVLSSIDLAIACEFTLDPFHVRRLRELLQN